VPAGRVAAENSGARSFSEARTPAYAVKVLAFGEPLDYKIVEIEIMRDNHESLLIVYMCSSALSFERKMNELQHGFCGELEGIQDNIMDPDLTSIVDF
jgi:hypothetical protein